MKEKDFCNVKQFLRNNACVFGKILNAKYSIAVIGYCKSLYSFIKDNKLYKEKCVYFAMNKYNYMSVIKKIKKGNFDIIIGNPPYGEKDIGDRQFHYKITESLLEKYNDKMIIVMPGRIASSVDNRFDHYKKVFTCLSSMVNVGNPFIGFANVNVDIFTFENHNVDKVNIRGKEYKSLFDITPFSDYENQFMNKIKSDYAKTHWHFMGYDKTKYNSILDDYSFSVNRENGAMNGNFFSNVLINEPVKNKNTMVKFLKNYNVVRKAVFSSNNKDEMINLKNAMKRALLRFGLIHMQEDQNMALKVFEYIPNIDWNDVKTQTDEGILEMVGFSKEKAEEYAKYVKDYMDKVDADYQSKKKNKRSK